MSKIKEQTIEALLTPREVADFLVISERTLQMWRMEGCGPRHIKVASNKVRYSPTELRTWVETRSAHKTSDGVGREVLPMR